jgi:hypothetical protein
MIKLESAPLIYKRYSKQVIWYLLDLWESKMKYWNNETIVESEKVVAFQGLQALRKIFIERGAWDSVNRRPVDPDLQHGMSAYGWID